MTGSALVILSEDFHCFDTLSQEILILGVNSKASSSKNAVLLWWCVG